MKLRTELIDGVCCVSPSSVDGFDEIRHDALAAHALMQAISETHIGGITTSDSVLRRADELMREWGYKDDS